MPNFWLLNQVYIQTASGFLIHLWCHKGTSGIWLPKLWWCYDRGGICRSSYTVSPLLNYACSLTIIKHVCSRAKTVYPSFKFSLTMMIISFLFYSSFWFSLTIIWYVCCNWYRFVYSRARTVDPNYSSYSSYPSSSYKSLARATTVSPSSAYSGYYGRSNVARAQDYRPTTTWYRPSRYKADFCQAQGHLSTHDNTEIGSVFGNLVQPTHRLRSGED